MDEAARGSARVMYFFIIVFQVFNMPGPAQKYETIKKIKYEKLYIIANIIAALTCINMEILNLYINPHINEGGVPEYSLNNLWQHHTCSLHFCIKSYVIKIL